MELAPLRRKVLLKDRVDRGWSKDQQFNGYADDMAPTKEPIPKSILNEF